MAKPPNTNENKDEKLNSFLLIRVNYSEWLRDLRILGSLIGIGSALSILRQTDQMQMPPIPIIAAISKISTEN